MCMIPEPEREQIAILCKFGQSDLPFMLFSQVKGDQVTGITGKTILLLRTLRNLSTLNNSLKRTISHPKKSH